MTAIVIEESVRIPKFVVDLPSFRRWASSDAYPRRGRFSFLKNEVWVDMSPEELFTHNRVKGEIASVITFLLKTKRLGWFFHDRALLSNKKAELSTEPDGMFASFETLRKKRVRLAKREKRFTEVEGTPDMVLEVVSDNSIEKDTVRLLRLYWLAGIPEYWLVDAREGKLSFEILRRSRSSYVPARKSGGWQPSAVFGKSFKLTMRVDELGYPEFTLGVR